MRRNEPLLSIRRARQKSLHTQKFKKKLKNMILYKSLFLAFWFVLTVINLRTDAWMMSLFFGFLNYVKANRFHPSVQFRDLKQWRRWRQGRRLEKKWIYILPWTFAYRLDLFSASIGLTNCPSLICNASVTNEDTKNKPLSFTYSKILRTWSCHVVVLQRTAKKCTKNKNARA